MAKRRMFSTDIVESDCFLDLPPTSQNLYFHLGMNADDRGFVNNPRTVMKACGSGISDVELLANKKFILIRGEGLILIKGWKINNYLRSDRFVESKHVKCLVGLYYEENGSYTEKETNIPCLNFVDSIENKSWETVGIPSANLDKKRIDKISKDKNSKEKININNNYSLKEIDEYCSYKNININTSEFYKYYSERGWKEKGIVRDYKFLIDKWRTQEELKKFAENETQNGAQYDKTGTITKIDSE